MVERQGGGNAAGAIRVTPAANYPANATKPISTPIGEKAMYARAHR